MSKLVHSYMIKNVHFDIDIYTRTLFQRLRFIHCFTLKKHQFPDASKLSPVINHALYYIIFRLSNA